MTRGVSHALAPGEDAPAVREITEELLLGTLLFEPEQIDAVRSEFESTGFSFHWSAHAEVWRSMLSICDAGGAVDAATLLAELGDAAQVGRLLDVGGGPRPVSVPSMVAVLIRSWRERVSVVLLNELTARANAGTMSLELMARGTAELSEELEALLSTAAPLSLPMREVSDVPPAPLIEGLFTAHEPLLLVGADGSFKSTVALHIAAAFAAGAPVFDSYAHDGGCVLFVSEEDGPGVLRNRAEAMVRGHGWDADLTLSRLFVTARRGLDLADSTCAAQLVREVRRRRPQFVVFDPLRDLHTGDENSSEHMAIVVRTLRRIGALAKPIVVHHVGVEGSRARGSSALRAAMREVLLVERTGAGTVKVSFEKVSRGRPPFPLTLDVTVVEEEGNGFSWQSATIRSAVTRPRVGDRAALLFVLGHLEAHANSKSGALRTAARDAGLNPIDVSTAIQTAEARELAVHRPGKHGAKLWSLTHLGRARLLTLRQDASPVDAGLYAVEPALGCVVHASNPASDMPRNDSPRPASPPLRGRGDAQDTSDSESEGARERDG